MTDDVDFRDFGTAGSTRSSATEILQQSFQWLTGSPQLLGALVVVELVLFISVVHWSLSLVYVLLNIFVGGAACIYAERELEMRSMDSEAVELPLATALREVAPRILALVAIYIVYFIALVVGLVLLIAPGIYLGARLGLAFPACILDGKSPAESLSTSWRLAESSILELATVLVLTGVVLLIVNALVSVALIGFLIAIPAAALASGVLFLSFGTVYCEARTAGE